MKGSLAMRGIFLALILIRGSAVSWCADLKGTRDEDCCGTTFHLPVSRARQKKGLAKELVLRLFQGCPGPSLGAWVVADWLKVDGKLCELGSSQCEPATAAKIRLEAMSHRGKRVFGTYSIDFSKARHEEGRFMTKYHHIGPKPICE
jgi:hypothetical protein